MPQSIASAVCNRLGYNVEILKQRGAEPWFVLLVAFPIHWITIALLVVIFGWGTEWEPWFLLCIIPHSLNMLVHSPASLYYDMNFLKSSWIEVLWGEVFVHGGGYCLVLVSLVGFLGVSVDLPFSSFTLTSVGLFVLTPLMFLVDHITSAAPTAIRGGSTPISIIVFHGVNGMRFIDPLADFVLGFRLLQQARHEDCPWHVGHASSRSADHMSTPGDCQWHHRLAWIIMIAAIIDFIILDCYIHLLKGMLKRISDSTKQIVAEAGMLLCEAAILACVMTMARFNMLQGSITPGGSDRGLEGYVILCSVSTFGSLGTTVLMLLLPASFWKRLETEKPWSIISNVAAGIGLTARVVWRTSVGRWTPRASANSAAIYPRQRRRSAYGNSSAGGRVAPECVEVEPTRAALAEAAPAGADTEAEGAGDTVPS